MTNIRTITYALAVAAGFLATIVAANWAVTEYGPISIGFGLTATAGTYFAGLAFILRDELQDAAGRLAVVGAIAAGGGLSYLVTTAMTDGSALPPDVTVARIAVASSAAFLLSELIDFAVYTPLRSRGYLRAAIASNAVGALVDTYVFLTVAGFALADVFAGQVVGKLTVTAATVGLVALARLRKAAMA